MRRPNAEAPSSRNRLAAAVSSRPLKHEETGKLEPGDLSRSLALHLAGKHDQFAGTHRRPERPRSVPNRWLCRPGFGCVIRSAKAGVMNAIQVSSARSPDLAVKQRSRDGASSCAEALADVQRSSNVEHGESGLDTTGSAPLPHSSNCDATTEAPWGFTRVVIAADSGSGSRGCLTRTFVEILERKHPGTRWYVDGVETRRAAEPSPRQSRRPGTVREDCDHETVVIAA